MKGPLLRNKPDHASSHPRNHRIFPSDYLNILLRDELRGNAVYPQFRVAVRTSLYRGLHGLAHHDRWEFLRFSFWRIAVPVTLGMILLFNWRDMARLGKSTFTRHGMRRVSDYISIPMEASNWPRRQLLQMKSRRSGALAQQISRRI